MNFQTQSKTLNSKICNNSYYFRATQVIHSSASSQSRVAGKYQNSREPVKERESNRRQLEGCQEKQFPKGVHISPRNDWARINRRRCVCPCYISASRACWGRASCVAARRPAGEWVAAGELLAHIVAGLAVKQCGWLYVFWWAGEESWPNVNDTCAGYAECFKITSPLVHSPGARGSKQLLALPRRHLSRARDWPRCLMSPRATP